MLTLSSLKTRLAPNPVGRLCFLAALSAVSAMGIGCMVGPNYVRPAVEQPLNFKSQAASGEAPLMARDWWRLYGDPDLDQLIASAQASNQTVRQAVAQVRVRVVERRWHCVDQHVCELAVRR